MTISRSQNENIKISSWRDSDLQRILKLTLKASSTNDDFLTPFPPLSQNLYSFGKVKPILSQILLSLTTSVKISSYTKKVKYFPEVFISKGVYETKEDGFLKLIPWNVLHGLKFWTLWMIVYLQFIWRTKPIFHKIYPFQCKVSTWNTNALLYRCNNYIHRGNQLSSFKL